MSKMRNSILTLIASIAVVTLAHPAQPSLPPKGDNGEMGGIFGIDFTSMGSGAPNVMGLISAGADSPKAVELGLSTTGSGPYPAYLKEDPNLPNHTIYAPKSPPPDLKLPAVVFGNGACMNMGTQMRNLLLEIASHGYLVIANGPPLTGAGSNSSFSGLPKLDGAQLAKLMSGDTSILLKGPGMGLTKVTQMVDAVDWISKGGAKAYGNIDTDKIAASGQSCGGLEAYSTAYHDPRVKLNVIFNSGVLVDSKRYLVKELKAPIGWFVGGPKDAAAIHSQEDYDALSPGVPAVRASLDTGHLGTYGAKDGGKYGKAAVAFLEWQFRGDEKAKAKFMNPNSPGSFVSENWNVTTKGF